MASTQEFVDFVVEQFDSRLEVRARKMFGEYGLHAGDVFIALICNDQLFLKPTDAGREYLGEPAEAPPYPGARNYFLIEELDDGEWLSELLRVTLAALPPPGKKRTRKKRTK